jgi:hypothetical protein
LSGRLVKVYTGYISRISLAESPNIASVLLSGHGRIHPVPYFT